MKPAEKEVKFTQSKEESKPPVAKSFLETNAMHGLPQRAKQVAPGHVVVSKEAKSKRSLEDLEDDEML